MSHMPNAYSYADEDYYYPEGDYADEYSEPVVYPENQGHPVSHNFTEIYRRPGAGEMVEPHSPPVQHVALEDRRFMQPAYLPPEYYYNQYPPSTQSQHIYDKKAGKYYRVLPSEQNQNFYAQQAQMKRPKVKSYSDTQQKIVVHSAKLPGKKYPVTVKTPRYYKRQSANTLYKRPSALCLPVISQPDPAIARKSKKSGEHADITCEPSLTMPDKRNMQEIDSPHKIDSEGDVNVNVKLSHLERLLAKYEQESRMDPLQASGKSDISKMAKFLKPRVPSSIKLKQEKQKMKVLSNYDIHPIPQTQLMAQESAKLTPDSLDKLLNQLKKCEVGNSEKRAPTPKPNTSFQKPKMPNKVQEIPIEDEEDPEPDSSSPKGPKSFNYRDISNHIQKSQSNSLHQVSTTSNETSRSDFREDRDRCSAIPNSRSFMNANKLPPLDDNCALELHKSKSYIVNLIDRALSKELGTIPCERWNKKEFENMSTKRAIDLVNRHCLSASNKDLCLEITSALTDSIISTATAPDNALCPPQASASNSSKTCSCQDEPTYIKQLKQLRWGHLKHIQREVRRLEDLERFLDACTNGYSDM